MADVGVPEKCGEHRQLLFNVFTSAIPVDQGLDRESMAEIVNTRPVALPLLPETDLPR